MKQYVGERWKEEVGWTEGIFLCGVVIFSSPTRFYIIINNNNMENVSNISLFFLCQQQQHTTLACFVMAWEEAKGKEGECGANIEKKCKHFSSYQSLVWSHDPNRWCVVYPQISASSYYPFSVVVSRRFGTSCEQAVELLQHMIEKNTHQGSVWNFLHSKSPNVHKRRIGEFLID